MKRYREIEALRGEYAQRSQAIRSRLVEFALVPQEEWFFELAYCLLTPQSSARSAGLAIEALRAAGFPETPVDPVQALRGNGYYIRFHLTKSRHLLAAAARRTEIGGAVAGARGSDGRSLRAWLVREVMGLGWKEASHFLRNIGFRNLAILDRHILRNLRRHGVIRTIPASLPERQYLAIEKAFVAFAAAAGVTMDELDLVFWSRETGEILK
jgi:N-glycosylase/DNA lyase